uniref:Retrovirus-related Pol polyprotein from transposon TNT 1-94 n=1 Tax=Tanacetum cinerariifolium TaxID=118510 RepID=A0A6L2L2W2_TANCI|nr:retrovirus-related Pol polyprotein from transposon TNT 1-94 [Tanacetum cinerariifolium]
MGNALVPTPSYASKPKNPPTHKKDNPVKDAICHQCCEVGHWRRNCPIYLAELIKKKKLSQRASTSGIFTMELYSFPSTSWVYDSGCGTHICITTQGLRGSRKLKLGALSLYVGDGHHAGVEAIGEFHLCLPSGLVLILHNCHYAPSITRGIISVSRLYKDGFANRFKNDNSIFVSKNNLIYFNDILRDDIYEIVMSFSSINDSSMFVVCNKRAKLNLDSALFWHCRHGHINKKSIEKLQQDGLLDSTDIKSFEKYVTCMSGKMARKPYSHQVERAKDLLGLIHTNEVENQCGKTIKSLRSDHEDHEASGSLEDLEIIQEEDTHPSLDIDLPPNGKSVGQKWLFKKKTDMDGAVYTYKARLVAKGFTQTPRIDYEETFSPIVDIRAIRILIAIAAFYDYEIWQMDVKTTFLNRYLNEEVYMEQPKASGSYVTFLILNVDDILIMGNNIPMLQDVRSFLGRCFAMKDLGEAAYILGIKIYRDRSKRLIGLCQSAYIKKILKRFYMENPKGGMIPMQEKLKFSKSQGASTPAKMQRMVSCYTDAGYLTDADDMKSQTGYVFILNRGAVDWKNTKQSIFATSSTYAEYIVTFYASKEAVWIRKFIFRLGVVPIIEEPINMYCENTRAIAITKDYIVTKGARHFHAKVHYL